MKKALDCRQRHIYSQTLLALECKSTFYVILQFCDNMTALFNVIITFKSVKKSAVMRFFWYENNYEFRTPKNHQKHSCFRFSCHTANKKAATKSTSLPQFYLICYVKINYFLFCKNVGTSKSSLALDLRLLEESTSSA